MANTITGSTTAMEYDGSGAQTVDAAVTVAGDNITGIVSVEIATFNASEDSLAVSGETSIPDEISVGTFAQGKLDLTCSAATPAQVNAILQTIEYTNSAGDDRSGSQRTVEFQLPDDATHTRYVWLRDPFTQVETELWALLEAHSSLSGIIKPLKHTGEDGIDDDPIDSLQPGDLAEVRLVPGGNTGTTNIKASSNGSFIGQRFNLMVASGERATRRLHNPIKWGVCKALAEHLADHPQNPLQLGPVTGGGQGIVNQLAWQVLAEVDGDPERDRGAVGWAALMAIDVRLWISDAQVRV